MTTKQDKQDTIKAAMSIARDVTDGRLDPADLDAELVDTCRQLFGTVAGPGDVLFELQRDVARQVLAAGGLSANEAAEWAVVLRRRTGAPDVPADVESTASGPHSSEIDGSEHGLEPQEDT